MALPADFNKIFGSTATGGLTPIGDVNYAKGWEFVGSNPPTKNDFSYLQNLSDLKSQWLYANKLQRTDPFGDIKSDGEPAVSAALSNLGLKEAANGVSVVGQSRNMKISIPAASATATFTADEVIVSTALGGKLYRLHNVNKSINLATTGAGGMDIGSPPASGHVALYVIYNPTTEISALLSVNATSTIAPEVYGGANMPAGYTASALVAVLPVASSQFAPCAVQGRSVALLSSTVMSGSAAPGSATSQTVSAIPLNSVSADFAVTIGTVSTDTTGAFLLASSSDLIGARRFTLGAAGTGGTISVTSNLTLPILANSRTIYWQIATANISYGVTVMGYQI